MACEAGGCDRPKFSRMYCRLHYERWRKHGDLTISYTSKGGIRSHFMYGAWGQMINRCENPNNSSYGRYGARGITVCERWHDFRNFLADMGERPAGKTLDRIDPTGPYAPENCRWATIQEQRKNLSPAGDARMRSGLSMGAKRRWEKWRADGNVAKPKHPPTTHKRHDKVCVICSGPFTSIRSDARVCSRACGYKKRVQLAAEF